MFRFSLSIKTLTAGALFAALAGGLPAAAMAKTFKVDCTKSGKLQTTIDSDTDGDEIVITGVCQENVVIRDKRLTLTGGAIGISVRDGSTFMGKRLQLHNNAWGLFAYTQSRANCDECDLNGNAWAARSWDYSTVSLRDSAVSSDRRCRARHLRRGAIAAAIRPVPCRAPAPARHDCGRWPAG